MPSLPAARDDLTALAARDMTAIAMRRMAMPEEIARLVLYVASDEASYSTGSSFLADGGFTAGYMSAD